VRDHVFRPERRGQHRLPGGTRQHRHLARGDTAIQQVVEKRDELCGTDRRGIGAAKVEAMADARPARLRGVASHSRMLASTPRRSSLLLSVSQRAGP
jgi:hypothetical protein